MTVADLAFAVRPYDEDDLRSVRQLLLECGWQENAIPSYDLLYDASLMGCAFVAVSPEVIGFIRALSDAEVVAYISELAVTPESRLHGVGRALVDAVAKEFPKVRIDVLSTPLAQSFYEEIGFTNKPGYRRWPT